MGVAGDELVVATGKEPSKVNEDSKIEEREDEDEERARERG